MCGDRPQGASYRDSKNIPHRPGAEALRQAPVGTGLTLTKDLRNITAVRANAEDDCGAQKEKQSPPSEPRP